MYSDFGPLDGAPGLAPRGAYLLFRPNTNCDANNPLALAFGVIVPSPAPCDAKAKPNTRSADWNPDRDYHRDNWFFFTSLRLDYKISEDITLTSLSSFQRFNRDELIEHDGSAFDNYQSAQEGKIETWYQELRLSGSFGGDGVWMVGGNYEYDDTFDQYEQQVGDSQVANTLGFLPGTEVSTPITERNTFANYFNSAQTVETWAAFANAEYPEPARL
jgi:hypothetical protein